MNDGETNSPIPAEAEIPALASLLRILSDESRLRILLALAGGERDVSALWTALRLPQSTVSHHLAILRSARLVAHRRCGKRVYYSLGVAARLGGKDTLAIECPHFALSFELRDGQST